MHHGPSATSKRSRLVLIIALIVAFGGCSGSDAPSAGTSTTRAAASPSKSTTAPPEVAPPPPMSWRGCPDKGKDLECGRLKVPLDYGNPGGATIDLQVSRRLATDKTNRLGVLLVSPGGPGITGVTFPPNFARFTSIHPEDAAASARFDLIGFDARGSGTDPFSCGEFTPLRSVDPEPDSTSEVSALKDAARNLAEACVKSVPANVLTLTSTATTARDIEQLRRALGEEKLNLYGLSYGTRILGTYAGMFPDHVRATVLDAAMVPSTDGLKLAREQMAALDEQFTALLARCGKDPACPFGGGDPLGAYDRLIKQWEDNPLPVKGGAPLTATQAMRGYTNAVFNTYARPGLLQALADADNGDATTSAALWKNTQSSNVSPSSALVHLCNDYTWPTADKLYRALVPDRSRPSRLAPAAAVSYLPCGSWPAKAGPAASASKGWPTRAKGTPPILVYGGTNDPSTPYAWSKQLTEHLDDAVLVTREGQGHVSLSRGACISHITARYLTDLATPIDGMRCPTDF